MKQGLTILYEDDALLVCEKAAGTPVQSKSLGRQDLEGMVRAYLMRQNGRRDNFAAPVHRLDQPVEGMVVFARTKEAAAALARQIQEHRWKKEYLAVTQGRFEKEKGRLVDYLKKDGRTGTSAVVPESDKHGKKSILEYEVLETLDACQLIRVFLLTGRHHQIRVQLSHAGHPIVEDMRYNVSYVNQKGHASLALAACRLTFTHPMTGKEMTFTRMPKGRNFEKFGKVIQDIYSA